MRKLMILAVIMIGFVFNGSPVAVEKQESKSLNLIELTKVKKDAEYLASYELKSKEDLEILAEKQRVKGRLYELRKSELTFDNFNEYLDLIGIPNKDIIIRKAIIESGWFKSSLTKKYNNIFGMCTPKHRETKALGTAFGKQVTYTDKTGRKGARIINYKYAKFKHWTDSVDDLVLWQNYWEDRGYDTTDYYKFLNDLGYAYESNYIKVLKSVDVKKYYPNYC